MLEESGTSMRKTVDLNSMFSVGLSKGRKNLIADTISLHVSLEQLLDVLVKENKIKINGVNTFYGKANAVKNKQLKRALIDFNKIRNECAHQRLDKEDKVRCTLKKCDDFIKYIKSNSSEKYEIVSGSCRSPLQSAVIVLFDDLAEYYQRTTSREHELDGFYYPGQKTLDDEISEIIGREASNKAIHATSA